MISKIFCGNWKDVWIIVYNSLYASKNIHLFILIFENKLEVNINELQNYVVFIKNPCSYFLSLLILNFIHDLHDVIHLNDSRIRIMILAENQLFYLIHVFYELFFGYSSISILFQKNIHLLFYKLSHGYFYFVWCKILMRRAILFIKLF